MSVILHMADACLGTGFENFPAAVAAACRAAQRKALRKMVAWANEQRAQAILIAGNLFEMSAPSQELSRLVFGILEEAQCPVLIAPEERAYLHEESPYRAAGLPENIHVFGSTEWSPFAIDTDTVVWGAACDGTGAEATSLPTLDAEKCNILLLRAEVRQESALPWLAGSGFDYAALGGEPAYSGILYAGKTAYSCAGALTGRGFHEPDTHGFLCGEVVKGRAELRFIAADSVTFLTWEQPMTHVSSDRELSRAIADRILHSRNTAAASRECDRPAPPEDFSNACLSLKLTGRRNHEPDVQGLLKALDAVFLYACVENGSVPPKEIWRYEQEQDLRGAVTRSFRIRYEGQAGDPRQREQTLYALQVALAAFDGDELPPLP